MWQEYCLILELLMLLQIVHTSQGQNTSCAANEFTCQNGECILQRWRCDDEADCKDTSDEFNCESYLPCNANQFQCKKNKNCITIKWRCDGDGDCSDMSDELNCYHSSCTPDEYRCTNGLCIDSSYLCDGDDDCGDESDESSCDVLLHCKENRFRCDEHRCIYKRWVCDGDKDCENGNDEKNCSKVSCGPRQWACQSGECILESHRCDGDLDCNDYSDEIGCPTVAGNCKTKGKFRCQSGQCISDGWRCDGDKDCSDGSDEIGCGQHTCPNNTILCPSSTGRCIANEWLCDGEKDCQDGYDEMNCTTKSSGCPRTQFYCTNGQCIDEKKVCNRINDCSDGSDEVQCPPWKNQTSCGANNGGCQHYCHDTVGSFYCSCKPGYQLDMYGSKLCSDVNECEIPGFCSQKCTDSQGNFTCTCQEGYTLQSDRRKCKAIGPSPSLLFSNQLDIRKVDTKPSEKTFLSLVVDGLENAVAVDYFFEEHLVFWTDTTLQMIKRAFMNGTEVKNVIKFGLDSPCGIAVDWLGKKLYWADSGNGRIEVSNFDGSQRKVVFWQPLGSIRAIALHPSNGYLYWTEWDVREKYSNQSSISRANMDGTDIKRILHQEISWPNGLVIDFPLERIFWIDAKLAVIHSANLDGTVLRTVMGNNDLVHPFAITVFEDDIYWTDPDKRAIYKANKFDGRDYTLVQNNLNSPMDITIFHPQRQPQGVYSCGENNGGCSHICLVTNSTGFSCACPTGYKLLNVSHCSEDIQEFIAYVGNFAIRQISLDTPELLDVVLPFESVMDVFSMDWDPVENEMYWADVNDEGQITIRKGRMNPPYYESVVYNFPGKLSGLGVDWLARKLYWSDELRNHIRVSNLDGTYATVLLWKQITTPKNLILDVPGRYMYWSGHGTPVTIKRAGMDGCCQRTIISKGLTNPTGLTMDKSSQFLYWSDGAGNSLHHYSLLTQTQGVIKLYHHSEILRPFSIAVHQDNLYWTDSKLKKVLYASKQTGKNAKVIGKYKSNPVRIGAFQRPKRTEVHPCNINNGGCSHLCLLSPVHKLRCGCPGGIRLGNDSQNCQSGTSRFVLANSVERLHQIPLSMSYKTNVLLPAQGNDGIFAFDIDIKQRDVYFTNKDSICYFSVFGGNETCILNDMVYGPGDLTVDPLRNYIYWTDYVTKKIYLAQGNGKFWTVIIWENLNIPSSISVAYKHGYIFWSDIGKPVSISRANMDGTSRIDIITSSIKLPNSLAVDHSAQRLYWSDFRRHTIEQCDLNGKNRIIIAQSLAGPTSIALLGRFIYWSEWESAEIKRADKTQGSNGVTLIRGMARVNGIKAVNLRRVPVSTNPCDSNNGGCSHFCLAKNAGIICACPVGLNLLEDGKQCAKSPMASLIFSTGYTITRISLDTLDFTGFVLPFKQLDGVFSLAYDVVMDRIYWTNTNGIYSAFTNDSDNEEVVKTNLSHPSSLVVDWLGRNLFWTNSHQKAIEVSRIDGSNKAVLISDMLERPCDLAVHPVKGYLFWTDCGNNSRIERSHLDGRSRSVLINTDINNPSGLAIDLEQELLYWTDSFYQTIQRCSFEGEKRSVVVKTSGHVFGLTLFGSYIYWTDDKILTVHRANTKTGSDREIYLSKVDQPKAIIAISRTMPPGRNDCSENNCTGLCLSTPTGRSCASICEGKLYLKDFCHVKEITVKPTTEENTSCVNGIGKGCSTEATHFAKKEKTMALVYIVGAIVLFVFLVTMCVLVYVCLRRYKRGTEKESRQHIIVPKVHFRKTSRGHPFNEKDIFASDPSITILPNNCRGSDESPIVQLSYKRTLSVAYEPNSKSATASEERQCLTISDV